jgi:hypothetical protein
MVRAVSGCEVESDAKHRGLHLPFSIEPCDRALEFLRGGDTEVVMIFPAPDT